MTNINEKIKTVFKNLKGDLGIENVMQAPKIQKVVVSVGVGRVRKEKQKLELIQDRLLKITGQKPSYRKAKKSIAPFKLREGDKIGYSVTLRGKMMESFLNRFINLAIPRMRDFRGIKRESIDEMGNLTIGVPEHTIFIETGDENIQDVFGVSVTIVTTAKNRDSAEKFLEHIGIPFVRKQ